MAGLLEGLGVIFGTAGAQGAKAYGESVAEQAKQEALSIREENMLRIKDIMDRGRQQEQNKFTEGLEGKRQKHESGETDKKLQAQRDLEAERQIFTAAQSDSDNETKIRLAEEASNQASMRQDKDIAAEKEKQSQATRDAKEILSYKNDLSDNEKSAVEKSVAGLKRLGLPQDKALAVALASVTKEEAGERRSALLAWQNAFVEGRKAGSSADEAAREASRITGVDPISLTAEMVRGRTGDKTTPAVKSKSIVDLYEEQKAARKKDTAPQKVETAATESFAETMRKKGLWLGTANTEKTVPTNRARENFRGILEK